MLAENDEHHFVVNVVERIGYPLWESATEDINQDGTATLVNIPFVKPGVVNTQAILTSILDDTSEGILYSVKSKKSLDSILTGEIPIQSETCRSCMEFGAFNFSIFGEQGELYHDLTCDACFPDPDSGNLTIEIPIQERTCQTVNITYCTWDEPSGQLSTTINSTGGGGTGDWIVWNPGLQPGGYVFWGPFGGGRPGGDFGGFDINISIGGILSGIWDFFRNLFTPSPKCPKFHLTEPEGEIGQRDGDDDVVYVCQTYTTLMCLNGQWWEVVESWPCPECDGNLTLAEFHAMQCSENSLAFMAKYNISTADLKKYGINLRDCCEEGALEEECAMRAVFTKIGLNEDEINTIFAFGVQEGVMLFLAEYGFEYLQEHVNVLKRAIECSEDIEDMYPAMEPLVFPQDPSNYTQIIQYIRAIRDACANRCTDYGYFEEFLTNWLYVVDTDPAAVSAGEIYEMGQWAKKLRDRIVAGHLLAFGMNVLDVLEVAAWEWDLFVARRFFSAVPLGARNWGMSRMLSKLNTPVSSFSAWQYAQKFGINSYDDLLKLFKDMKWSRTQKGVEFHHLVEQRFDFLPDVVSWVID